MSSNAKKILLIVALTSVAAFIFLKFIGNANKKPSLATKQVGDAGISGTWDFEVFGPPPSDSKALFKVTLQQNKNSLLGTYEHQVKLRPEVAAFARIIRGEVNNDSVHILFLSETFPLLDFNGIVHAEGQSLEGECKFNTGQGFVNQPNRIWRATKVD